MSSPGVIAITPDKGLGKTLRLALTAAGAEATSFASRSELPAGNLDASLVVLHQTNPDADAVASVARHLNEGSQLIVILPQGDLAATVAVLQSHERVAGVLNADRIRPQEVTAMVTRLLFGDIFGLDKVLPWGARIHALAVGSYEEKSAAIETISTFAASLGIRRKYRENIEQCCDEMLMNALYDAPVDEDGKPLSDKAPGSTRTALTGSDKAIIEYGFDGDRFAVAVRDPFGRFERSVLVRYLDKCLHSNQQIDKKAGGAGLGLYLMSNSATSLIFNLLPGIATECVCTFDVGATKVELEQLAVVKERVDAAGRLLSPRGEVHPFPIERRRSPSGTPVPMELVKSDSPTADAAKSAGGQTIVVGRGFAYILSLAVLMLVAAIGMVAYKKFNAPATTHTVTTSHTTAPKSPAETGKTGNAGTAANTGTAANAGAILTVRASVAGLVTVEGSPACSRMPLPLAQCALPPGNHHVHVFGNDPQLNYSFPVAIGTDPVLRDLQLGVVEALPGYSLALSNGQPLSRRLAIEAGELTILLADEANGAVKALAVEVLPDQTIRVP